MKEPWGEWPGRGEGTFPGSLGALLQALGCWDQRSLAHSAHGALGGEAKEKVTSLDLLFSWKAEN